MKSSNFLLKEMTEQMVGIDITGDNTQDIQIEISKRPDGKPVIYIHCEGITILRLCQPKSIKLINNFKSPKKKSKRLSLRALIADRDNIVKDLDNSIARNSERNHTLGNDPITT